MPTNDPRPQPPVQPELEDCCRSGCTPCVFDVYQDALERYRKELAAWEATMSRRSDHAWLGAIWSPSVDPTSASP